MPAVERRMLITCLHICFWAFQIRQALKIVIQPSGSGQLGNQCFNIAFVYLFMGYFQLGPADVALGTI